MRSTKTAVESDAPSVYTIWFGGRTKKGSAQSLLHAIRLSAAEKSDEIRKLTTEQYASRIIADAGAYLPADLFAYLKSEHYESDFDRALRYLAEMASSGVRILAKN